MSQCLARELKVPLVGSFNDWFDFSGIIHPLARPLLEIKFRSFYRACPSRLGVLVRNAEELACTTTQNTLSDRRQLAGGRAKTHPYPATERPSLWSPLLAIWATGMAKCWNS